MSRWPSLASLAFVLGVGCDKKVEVVTGDPVGKPSVSVAPSASVSASAPKVVPSYAVLGEPSLDCPVFGFGALGGSFGLTAPMGDAGPSDSGPGESIGLGSIGLIGGGTGRLRQGITGRLVKAGPGLVDKKAGAVVCTALPLVRACYDEAQKGRPPTAPLSGSLELELEISDKGKVDRVLSLLGSTLTEPALGRCVTEAVEKLVFDTTAATKLEYHFRFEPAPRTVKMSDKGVVAKGDLPPEVIKRILRASFGRFRSCYNAALGKDPKLTGKTIVQFTIDGTGAVSASKLDPATTVTDATMQTCVLGLYKTISFPMPDKGTVDVTHTMEYAPE